LTLVRPWRYKIPAMATELQEIERKMNELAREYAETKDPAVKAELEKLSHRHSKLEIEFAVGVLTDALARCREEDLRNAKVFVALEFLDSFVTEEWAV